MPISSQELLKEIYKCVDLDSRVELVTLIGEEQLQSIIESDESNHSSAR